MALRWCLMFGLTSVLLLRNPKVQLWVRLGWYWTLPRLNTIHFQVSSTYLSKICPCVSHVVSFLWFLQPKLCKHFLVANVCCVFYPFRHLHYFIYSQNRALRKYERLAPRFKPWNSVQITEFSGEITEWRISNRGSNPVSTGYEVLQSMQDLK